MAHSGTERTIHTLHLSAPHEALIQRGAILVEDALHTASLPTAARGRLLLIRSLPLGKIRAGKSPATLALQIEQRLRWLSSVAVAAQEPKAAEAPAVYFHDEIEPYVQLILRLSQNFPAHEWFWPLAVRGWQPERSGGMRWALLALAEAFQAAGLMAMVDALIKDERLEKLLEVLRPEDGVALMHACGWSLSAAFVAEQPQPIEESRALSYASAAPLAMGATSQKISHWLLRWGHAEARSLWLAGILAAVENPARLVLLQSRPQILAATTRALYRQASAVKGAALEQSLEHPATPPTAGTTSSAESAPYEPEPGEWSYAAGLYLLLPIVARFQIEAMLATYPHLAEGAFAVRLLHFVAEHLGVPADDPALLAIPLPAEAENVAMPPSFSAQASFCRAHQRRIGLARQKHIPQAASSLVYRATRRAGNDRIEGNNVGWRPLLDCWLGALRRYLRRYLAIGLGEVVLRRGKIVATRSHIDLFYDHSQADLRIRRAGLDLDPGWLPWLGRIVSFHYETLNPTVSAHHE